MVTLSMMEGLFPQSSLMKLSTGDCSVPPQERQRLCAARSTAHPPSLPSDAKRHAHQPSQRLSPVGLIYLLGTPRIDRSKIIVMPATTDHDALSRCRGATAAPRGFCAALFALMFQAAAPASRRTRAQERMTVRDPHDDVCLVLGSGRGLERFARPLCAISGSEHPPQNEWVVGIMGAHLDSA